MLPVPRYQLRGERAVITQTYPSEQAHFWVGQKMSRLESCHFFSCLGFPFPRYRTVANRTDVVCQFDATTASAICDVFDNVSMLTKAATNACILCLSFKPLFAALIAFREWDVFFFGTANTIDGNSSSREPSDGSDRVISGQPSAAEPSAGANHFPSELLNVGNNDRECVSVSEAMRERGER